LDALDDFYLNLFVAGSSAIARAAAGYWVLNRSSLDCACFRGRGMIGAL